MLEAQRGGGRPCWWAEPRGGRRQINKSVAWRVFWKEMESALLLRQVKESCRNLKDENFKEKRRKRHKPSWGEKRTKTWIEGKEKEELKIKHFLTWDSNLERHRTVTPSLLTEVWKTTWHYFSCRQQRSLLVGINTIHQTLRFQILSTCPEKLGGKDTE